MLPRVLQAGSLCFNMAATRPLPPSRHTMSQSTSPLKKSVTGWIFAALVALGLAAYYLFQYAPSGPAPQTQTERSRKQAMKALMALPELKLWSGQIEKNSGGKLRGALIEYDPKPRILNGKSYWQFAFVENGAEAAHHIESFLVESGGSDILVEDPATDDVLSLERWRKEKQPQTRIVADD
jgi:hypothetical protein